MHAVCNTDTVYHRMDTGLSWPLYQGDAKQEGYVSNCLIMYSDEPAKDKSELTLGILLSLLGI